MKLGLCAGIVLGLLGCALLAGCVEVGKPYEPDNVRNLPRCEDQARLAHASARDCVFYVLNGVSGFQHAPAMQVRYAASHPGAGDGAVTIDLYSDNSQRDVVREAGLKGYDYPVFTDVSGKAGDILVPLQRADKRWVLSVWVWTPTFLESQRRREDRWVHAGDIPLGRVLHLNEGFFLLTASDFKGPLRLTLYRAIQSRIDYVGSLTDEGASNDCHVTPEGVLASVGSPLTNVCTPLGKPRDYGDCYGLNPEGAAQCLAALYR